MYNLIKALMMSCIVLLSACGNSHKAAANSAPEPTPQSDNANPDANIFCADSAFSFVAQQVAFGPRVPGSQASKQCAQWLCHKLDQFGAENIRQQHAQLQAYNGDKLDICNISAQFDPANNNRILLLSHWDSRPWADQEPNPADRNQPIDGANDGASGVAVILELARCLDSIDSCYGIDVLFVDAEDYGRREDDPAAAASSEDTWALGTQYWIENPTIDTSKVQFAILLDMVGGKNAIFPREYHSQYAAAKINDLVWAAARKAKQGDRFPNSVGGAIVDDHVYLLMGGIPAIDIIESANPETGSFNPTWHTRADNIDNIDPATLGAVGQTLLQLISSK